MQPINRIIIYYWVKKLKKRFHVLKADIITIKKTFNLMSLAQRMYFLQDVFQMTAVVLVSVINHYHFKGLHLFWDTLYIYKRYTLKIFANWQFSSNHRYQNFIISSGTKMDIIKYSIGLMSRVFANGLGDQGSVPGQVIPDLKNATWCYLA